MDPFKLHLTAEYSEEVLRYLLELERNQPRLGDYMKHNAECQVWMRDKLVKWVAGLCTEIRMSTHASQLALSIIALFLSKVKTPKSALQLVGVIGLMVSAKYEEGIDYTLEHAYNHAARLYPKQDIITAELYCLEKLEWVLHYPTAAELTRQLLFITGVQYDFSRIIERSDQLTTLCYIDYELSQFGSLAVAVVCTQSALEQFKQFKFRDEWLELLFLKVQLRMDELDSCYELLLQILDREGTESSETAKLTKGRFSLIMTQAHHRVSEGRNSAFG